MSATRAHVSIDLDTVDSHLAGYGIAAEPCRLIYEKSVPRILDLLDRHRMQATFFVIAKDAAAERGTLREMAARGHEVASHSLTHPIPFRTLAPADLERELAVSRARLEDAIGRPVVGFRAPGWDVEPKTLAAIEAAGYRYDASVMPSPAAIPGAVLRFVLSRGAAASGPGLAALRMALSPRAPYRVGAAGTFWEFPVAVSPLFRVPFIHTLWYLAPRILCRRIYRTIRRSGVPLSYQFHAADLLDLEADRIDARMSRHPGMRLPLAKKLAFLETMLAEIRRDYAVETFASATAH
jgi:hypothetical protein